MAEELDLYLASGTVNSQVVMQPELQDGILMKSDKQCSRHRQLATFRPDPVSREYELLYRWQHCSIHVPDLSLDLLQHLDNHMKM